MKFVIKGSTRQGNIIFSKTFSISDAFDKQKSTTKLLDVQLRDAALVICEIILSRESKSFSIVQIRDAALVLCENIFVKRIKEFQY